MAEALTLTDDEWECWMTAWRDFQSNYWDDMGKSDTKGTAVGCFKYTLVKFLESIDA